MPSMIYTPFCGLLTRWPPRLYIPSPMGEGSGVRLSMPSGSATHYYIHFTHAFKRIFGHTPSEYVALKKQAT